MPVVAQHSERINFRLAPKAKDRIERAAAAKGMTLTQFAVITLMKEADDVLKSNHILVLSDADRDAFLKALDNPPAPNARLKQAAKRYKEAKGYGRLRSI